MPVSSLCTVDYRMLSIAYFLCHCEILKWSKGNLGCWLFCPMFVVKISDMKLPRLNFRTNAMQVNYCRKSMRGSQNYVACHVSQYYIQCLPFASRTTECISRNQLICTNISVNFLYIHTATYKHVSVIRNVGTCVYL